MELNKFDAALEDFLNGLKLNKNGFELNFHAGICYFKLKKFKEADETFNQALLSSSNSEERDKLVIWQNKARLEMESYYEVQLKRIQNMKFTFNWYQTKESIYLTLDSNAVLNKGNFSIKVDKRKVAVYFDNHEKVYELCLANAIDETSVKQKIMTQKIEIIMQKEVKNVDWINLDTKTVHEVQKYPTSNKNRTDFVKIDKEIHEEMKNDKIEGNDAMMKLFREIYSNGNEETKKAMMKSYSTSGGTVLSTTWAEVKEKEYDGKDRPSAPDGQVWMDEIDKDPKELKEKYEKKEMREKNEKYNKHDKYDKYGN